jgi:O-antigen ligase
MNPLARVIPAMQAIAFACIPLFPGFITLTAVAFPGVSIVPLPIALAVIIAMGVAAIFALLALIAQRSAPALLRPLLAWFAAFALATIFGINPRDGAVFLLVFALGLIWYSATDRFYDAPGVARAIWWSYMAAGTLAVLAAIAMDVTRIPASLYAIANGRAVGTFVLPGELAGYLIFFIPVAYALAVTARSAALRVLAWTGCASGALAMLLTFSRTGWVGLAAALAFLAVMRSQNPRLRVLRGAAIVAAALVIVALLFNEHHNPSENYTRVAIWQAALGAIDRFPLTGVGPFGFAKIYPFVRMPDGDPVAFHAHSLYLTFLAEGGIIAILAFCWLIVAAAREWYRRVRAASYDTTLLATAIAAGVAGALVQGLIDTVTVVIFGLLFPMLALALASARSGACDA